MEPRSIPRRAGFGPAALRARGRGVAPGGAGRKTEGHRGSGDHPRRPRASQCHLRCHRLPLPIPAGDPGHAQGSARMTTLALTVAHWMDMIAGWKQMLGADWNKTYAASNTIYVARQNNILFSVLAQFFGPQAINDRLILIETISFTTTPEEMLESLTRIISDRSVGAAFFGNYYLMDHELMGGWRRRLRTARSGRGGCAHAGGGRGRWSGLSANSACLLEEAFPFPPQLKAPPSVCRFAVPPGRQSELPGLDQDVATTQRALEAVQGIEDVIHLFPFRSVGLPEFRHSGL